MRFSLSTSNYKLAPSAKRGMTLIEVLFTIGIFSMLFVGIYGVFRVSIEVVSGSKARAGALALAQERMEELRSLPYASVGTLGGIPQGMIEQSESVTLNQTTYTRRTFIEYADDPADGLEAEDENGITADYKVVKVEMVWTVREVTRTYSQVSTIVPPGIESLTGGGTLRIQVYDALAAPLSGATVRVLNTTGSSTIDVTTYTNAQGVVTFPGTPVGVEYQVTASKAGYSTARTYTATAGNPNPTPGHLSIANSQTTSASLFIDRLSALTVRTLRPVEEVTWEDEFDSDTLLTLTTSTVVEGGGLVLEHTGDTYVSEGSAMATSTAPSYLDAWSGASWTATVPSGTALLVRVYHDVSGVLVLVPDADLPGNSSGFSSSPIDLSSLSITTYPSLALGATLATTDSAQTPDLRMWEISYGRGPTPIADVAFALRGEKTIGTTGAGAAIYKFDESLSTGGDGTFSTTTMEWDTYPLTVPSSTGYDIAEACSGLPLIVAPNTSVALDLYLVAHTSHSLRVSAKDASGTPVEDASVRLVRTGTDIEKQAGSCGQAFFPSLVSAADYTVEVEKTGYQSATLADVDITGSTTVDVTLTPL